MNILKIIKNKFKKNKEKYLPETLEEAVDFLDKQLDEKDAKFIFVEEVSDWIQISKKIVFGRHIRNTLKLWGGNEKLIDNILAKKRITHCENMNRKETSAQCSGRHPDCISKIILEDLEKRIKERYKN